MALLDRDQSLIVLRVVYDGPPEAGKTTSLRALAGSLGQPLYSPAEEGGRTLFFDWMDYTGGRFEGHQIRCQIVSVPGQRELHARRRHLLAEADVVVFVADSRRACLPETLERLGEVPRMLANAAPPPVGLILQANKRDLADAVPLPELQAAVRTVAGSVGVVESVAADATGIRETFVFAVRLALDRVREQMRTRTLPAGRPEIDSGVALLAAMQQAATPEDLPPAAPLLAQVLAENDPSLRHPELVPWRDEVVLSGAPDAPLPPDPSAPSGAIWPPVEGRVILHEATASPMTMHRLRHGGWAAGIGNGWRAFSGGDAAYDDLEAGREMLIRLARLHVAAGAVLSPSRCIVLAATGRGGFRLWQIVRAERSLRDGLDDLGRLPAEDAAARLVETAALLADIGARLQELPCHLPCSLDTIGRSERGPAYIGLMPMQRAAATARPRFTEALSSELGSVVHHALYDRRAEVLAALARAPRAGLLDEILRRIAAAPR